MLLCANKRANMKPAAIIIIIIRLPKLPLAKRAKRERERESTAKLRS